MNAVHQVALLQDQMLREEMLHEANADEDDASDVGPLDPFVATV